MPEDKAQPKLRWSRFAKSYQLMANAYSPSPGLQQIFFRDGADGQSLHRPGHLLADFRENLGIVVVRGRDHNGAGPRVGLFTLRLQAEVKWRRSALHEDARADEDRLGSQFHHHRGVGRRRSEKHTAE